MTATDDLARWNAVAAKYAVNVGGERDSFYRRLAPFLWSQLGDDLAGRRVLDVGCGHGWLADILHSRGADVVGIDGSSALVRTARGSYPDSAFVVHDLTEPLPAGLGVFDAAVAHMVLMDLPEIDTVMHGVAAALRPGGVFVFSILHPSFYSHPTSFYSHPITPAAQDGRWVRSIDGYLREASWTVDSFGGHTHYHRSLAAYVQSVVANGFTIVGLDEPPSLPSAPIPHDDWTEYQRWFSEIPTMLSMSCKKPR